MNKQEVQQRVSHNGKPISMDDFMWDEKANTFSSELDGLVLDFKGISHCTFKTGSSCTFKTDSGCTFKTGSYCTFATSSGCTFNTGYNCVVVRRDVFEVIILNGNESIKLLPYAKKGYIIKLDNEDYYHYPNQTDRIEIIDSIVSKVIQQKGNVLKVINEGETEGSYIVSNGDKYAHGRTIKKAKESLIYKIADRNTDQYKSMTLDSEVTFEEGVEMYRKITGSCESQTKVFAEAHRFKGKKTIKEILEITKGQFNHNVITTFFNQLEK